jgi:hypothetical protein
LVGEAEDLVAIAALGHQVIEVDILGVNQGAALGTVHGYATR